MSEIDIDRLGRGERMVEMPPLNVVDALIRVVRDLPAIGKDEQMDQGGGRGYKYRGIESMTAAVQPLFGRHGVLVCPEVLETTTEPITKGDKPWVHRTMRVKYILRGPQGEKDYVILGPFVAEADDNSDKSANKCMTQAFKQMLLQVLCISDRKDDPDDANVDRDAAKADPALEEVNPEVVLTVLRRAVADGYADTEFAAVVAEVTGRQDLSPVKREWPAIRDAWTAYKAQNPRQAPEIPSDPPTPVSEASTALSSESASSGGTTEVGSRSRKRGE